MPIHRLPRGTMHEDLRAIEHDGEEVVSIAADVDPGFVLVATRWVRPKYETRLIGGVA